MSPSIKNYFYENYWKKNSAWSPSAGSITREEKLIFHKYLKPGSHVLDYGCGDGYRYGNYINSLQVSYKGYDISVEAVQAAASHLDILLFNHDGRTSESDNSFDAVLCFEVLEHLLDVDLALSEIVRVLKKGGVLLASVPNSAFITTRLELALLGNFNPGGSPLTARKKPWMDAHIRFFSRCSFRKMIEEHGFDVVEQPAEPFSLLALPLFYKAKGHVRSLLRSMSIPLAWIGRLMPGLLSPRIFIVARKSS